MTDTALEQARLWVAALSEPTAIVVFGFILTQRLRAMHRAMLLAIEVSTAKFEHAVNNQTNQLGRLFREAASDK